MNMVLKVHFYICYTVNGNSRKEAGYFKVFSNAAAYRPALAFLQPGYLWTISGSSVVAAQPFNPTTTKSLVPGVCYFTGTWERFFP